MNTIHSTQLSQAACRAYAEFRQQYPTWADNLVDWHFVQTHLLPSLSDSLNHHRPIEIDWLAKLWAGSAGLSEKTKARWQPKAERAIEVYLGKLQCELPGPSVVLKASLSG
jgi:hypothetical protein